MVVVVLEGWEVGGTWGLTSLNRPSQWGWATCMGPIPMQPAASLPQSEGREETESEAEGQRQKDREGAPRENGGDEEEERKKKAHTQRGERAGPQSIKGC